MKYLLVKANVGGPGLWITTEDEWKAYVEWLRDHCSGVGTITAKTEALARAEYERLTFMIGEKFGYMPMFYEWKTHYTKT